MKRIIAFLAALAITASVVSVSVFADTAATGTELIAKQGKVTVDGKKSSGEWDGAQTLVIDSSNTTLTIIKEGVTPYDGNKITVSFKYDDNYLYILEERESDYIYTAFNNELKHQVYKGDSTDYYFSLYVPGAPYLEQQHFTADVLIGIDSSDRPANSEKTYPMYLTRQGSFQSSTWGIPENTNRWKIASTLSDDVKSSVTEVAVAWEALFQGNSQNGSEFVNYKKYIKQFAKAGGLAIKFGVVINEGDSNRNHCYTYAYGMNVETQTGKGTCPLGDDILSWATLYLGDKNLSESGQIDLQSIVDEAIAKENGEGDLSWLIWVGVALAVIIIAVIIVFNIFGIKLKSEDVEDEEDDEDDEEDEEDEEDKEDEDDED